MRQPGIFFYLRPGGLIHAPAYHYRHSYYLLVVCLFSNGRSADIIQHWRSGRKDRYGFRPAGGGLLETETADDFVLGQAAFVTSATFVGLLPTGVSLGSVTGVEIELYHVFPVDSTNPPDGRVVTRTNSPSDNEFMAFDSGAGSLTFTTTLLNPSFTANNSVVNGINPMPNQFTAGEGAVTGQEVEFDINFTTPFS